jgi:uncharacterized damage-inducible protein DinB
MSVLRNIRMLTRYAAWANNRIFDVLAQLPDGEAIKSRPTLFGNMVHTLNHAYVADLIWKAHLLGTPHGFTSRNTETTPELGALRENQVTLDNWYINYADKLSSKMHDEIVNFSFVDGGAGVLTRGDILLHVVNHKTFHRGFVADMLYQVPVSPPSTDLPVFLRDVPGWYTKP